MATVSAKQLRKALQKARDIGQVEEAFTIIDCSIVLRNLRPDEYQQILAEIAEYENTQYLNEYQIGHLCRSIIELDGQDLRGVDYVQVDVEDPQTGVSKEVKIERHVFIRDEVVSTWSKEAIGTTFRKFLDVVEKAETLSREGIKFVVPDESPEDKFRRLLEELRLTEADLPTELTQKILSDAGLMHMTTAEEFKATDRTLSKVVPVAEATEESQALPPPSFPKKAPEVQQVEPVAASTESLQDIMRKRVPLNRAPTVIPEAPVALPKTSNRHAEIAELESLPLVESSIVGGPPIVLQQEAGDLSRPMVRIDAKQLAASLDPPPPVGINPRFRRPPKL